MLQSCTCIKCSYNFLARSLFVRNSIEKEWPYFTINDWKTFDILLLPEHDRAYNKLVDIDDFLDELKIGGEIVDGDIFSKLIPRKSGMEEEFGYNRIRRMQKVGELHKSPFRNRTIDLNRAKLTKEEDEVWNWIYADRQGGM